MGRLSTRINRDSLGFLGGSRDSEITTAGNGRADCQSSTFVTGEAVCLAVAGQPVVKPCALASGIAEL